MVGVQVREHHRQDVTEHDLKAAFVYNFLIFAEWPEGRFADKDSPMIVGIVGKDPFNGALEKAFNGRTAHGRNVEIRRFESVKDLKDCHLLFVPDSERKNLADVLADLKAKATLVVTESPGLAARGAALNLVVEEKKVKIEANPDAAGRASVKLSAKLLKLARIVKDEGGK